VVTDEAYLRNAFVNRGNFLQCFFWTKERIHKRKETDLLMYAGSLPQIVKFYGGSKL
jgi:hypothetical protein